MPTMTSKFLTTLLFLVIYTPSWASVCPELKTPMGEKPDFPTFNQFLEDNRFPSIECFIEKHLSGLALDDRWEKKKKHGSWKIKWHLERKMSIIAI